MTRNLPTGFDDWQRDAQIQFLSQARKKTEVMAILVETLDREDLIGDIKPQKGGQIPNEVIAEICIEIYEL